MIVGIVIVWIILMGIIYKYGFRNIGEFEMSEEQYNKIFGKKEKKDGNN
jgi:hypothetical protein